MPKGARSGRDAGELAASRHNCLRATGDPAATAHPTAPSGCLRSLRTRRRRISLPDTNATVPGLQAHSFGADTTREGAAFLAWGAGVDASSTRSTLDSVDVAPTLAAALDLGETLGRAPDGALGLTALGADGQAQPGVISSGSTQQVVLIVVDGLSDAVLDEFIDSSQGFS